VSVAIRINTVHFVNRDTEKKGSKNIFEGDILQASYLGDIIDYRIRLGKWMVRTESRAKISYQISDRVQIFLPPEELIIIPEEKL
jgi:ribosomal 50S subunit-recycling heat shock protein